MNIQLIKETQLSSDIFYRILIDEQHIQSLFGGNDSSTEQYKKERLHDAITTYEKLKVNHKEKIEILISETI
jgi:hypothetical protein